VPAKEFNAFCAESLAACRRLYPEQETLFSPDADAPIPVEGVVLVPSEPVGAPAGQPVPNL
jgi:hypothetical protein